MKNDAKNQFFDGRKLSDFSPQRKVYVGSHCFHFWIRSFFTCCQFLLSPKASGGIQLLFHRRRHYRPCFCCRVVIIKPTIIPHRLSRYVTLERHLNSFQVKLGKLVIIDCTTESVKNEIVLQPTKR